MKIKYLGHSAFLIKTNENSILIDPFVDFSKDYSNLQNFKKDNIKAIFVTHAHNDHLGSAFEISKITGAPIIGVFEFGNFCASQGIKAIACGLGGKLQFEWGNATLVPAQHTNSFNGHYMGVSCGVVLNIENKNIYHAGDTSLSSEMNMIYDFYKPEISMLPIGGHYTMGIDEACYAATILKSKTVIPMHYNSFPQIKVNISEYIDKMNSYNQKPTVMEIDEEIEL